MCTPSYRMTGWGHRHHGSPFMLVAGILVVAAIFKSGLWLPLLGLGLLAFTFAHRGGGWRPGWGPEGMEGPGRAFGPQHGRHRHGPFGPGEEKPKHPFGPRHDRPWYGNFEPDAEKPKRDHHDDEYV